MHGLSSQIAAWRNARNALVERRSTAWQDLLRKFATKSKDAEWLLNNPMGTELIYPDAWCGEREKRAVYADHCSNLLDDCSEEMSLEEKLTLYEAFPEPKVIRRLLAENKFPPELLLKYNLGRLFEREGDGYWDGLLALQAHLKKLPLAEQVHFVGVNRSKRAMTFIGTVARDDMHEFYLRFLEEVSDHHGIERELSMQGLSFADFSATIDDFMRIVGILENPPRWVVDQLASSQNHAPEIVAYLKLWKQKEEYLNMG